MTCNLCGYRTEVNEAQDQGAETWLEEQEPYGFNLFVVPKGAAADLRLRRDNTYGPQRKAWFNEMPEKCACSEHVKLARPASAWKPDITPAKPEPEPEPFVEKPRKFRRQGESLSLL